ncbi:hypothetical protein ACP70R_037801 [Stipagrostis hirtigluma subsp. patula]
MMYRQYSMVAAAPRDSAALQKAAFICCLLAAAAAAAAATSSPHGAGFGSGCVAAERAALLAFKAGITSDPANRLGSWRGHDCCLWRGVRCSNRTGHVVMLDLHDDYVPRGYLDRCE